MGKAENVKSYPNDLSNVTKRLTVKFKRPDEQKVQEIREEFETGEGATPSKDTTR